MKELSVYELRDVFFENYYKRIGFFKDRSYYSMKRLKKERFIVACKQIKTKNT